MIWRPESASTYKKSKIAGSNNFLMGFLKIVIFGAWGLLEITPRTSGVSKSYPWGLGGKKKTGGLKVTKNYRRVLGVIKKSRCSGGL